MGRLNGLSTVITGGASGMGRATVELWLEEGANVVVGDLNRAGGERLLEELGDRFGDRLSFVPTDVSKEPDMAALVAAAVSARGRLDVMFNNAGIDGAFGPVTDIEVEHWDSTFAILTRSVFLGIKHAARVMKTQPEGGSIINTGSLASLMPGAGPLVYTAAKAAVLSVSQAAALELGRYRIRVNTICPGIIYTPMMHRGKPEMADQVSLPVQPLPFRGESLQIARAALFLASSDSEFITGDIMRVDGGLSTVGPLAHLQLAQPAVTKTGMSFGTTGRRTEIRTLIPGE